jgi:DNA adenine methylase
MKDLRPLPESRTENGEEMPGEDSVEYFGPLLTDVSKIRREAVRRRKTHDERTVAPEQIPELEAEGWEVDKKLKRATRMKRLKSIDERLENRFWLLLAKLAYPEINDGRKFNVVIERKGAAPLRKQVDVFAQDDETVIVAECKASAKFTKRSLQKDIEEFANLKGPIADSNVELINAYRCIKSDYQSLEDELNDMQGKHSEKFYYKTRSEDPPDRLQRAARFIYLNRTCFNGMYRVNKDGKFNVPIGTKSTVAFERGYLKTIAETLKNTTLRHFDFEKTLALAQPGDFAFIDPPYTVMHNNNGFNKYNAKLFSWEDQVRLAKAVKRTAERGVFILLSNADHLDVRALYENFGEHIQVGRASVLSGEPAGRRATTELIVRSYNLERSPWGVGRLSHT